jgi:crotonobetainyl-CoA:carnitine CoA-transferase CaiB-like acyl-CoA transferase
VAAEPLIHHDEALPASRSCTAWENPGRPLEGVRVLDLTRVLAGPVATRFLAAYGAQVLRLDPPDWTEPGMVPEVTVGKRCAPLDLRRDEDRARFETLLAQADVLVHGYRPGALDRLGFDAAARQALRPGLVDVCLSAWGWSGPWRMRRGFDSLVQMSTGIAWPGDPDSAPDPLPVQALDQATGYLMAACALRGLAGVRDHGCGSRWRVSLARTALLLTTAASLEPARAEPALPAAPPAAYDPDPERTAWGPARRLLPPCDIGDARWRWNRGAVALRGDAAEFR